MKHGECGTIDWSHARWCRVHGWHGGCYPCPEYDAATLEGIAEIDRSIREKLADGRARRELMDQGASESEADTIVSILHILGGDR